MAMLCALTRGGGVKGVGKEDPQETAVREM